ncbi:MaoC family dehydratase [Halioxenophilus sp. WMMB6]|uniref:MaoC family dehydratase n=1 Tax=Halioxenophilus sp. WMMB6 TaxID=3073815 RepID=UPI00295EB0B3|nr:MaoC/PaaZ C-terminal domain-containing protein [Halioxenophilus sp. WMMB6]
MNLNAVINHPFAALLHTLTADEAILYALGVGFGGNPDAHTELAYVYEEGLRVFPTQAVVIAHPHMWIAEPPFAIDWQNTLHAEQAIEQHRPLQVGERYRGEYQILGVVDKGEERGALVYQQNRLFNTATDELTATVKATYFLRGDGGCGSTSYQPPAVVPMPERVADEIISVTTASNAALIYRLSGDRNPLHASPRAAQQVGFERPLLHGLCSYGYAARALVNHFGDGNGDRLQQFSLRFSAPVYPGETLRLHCWHSANGIQFNAEVVERGCLVLNQGFASFYD